MTPRLSLVHYPLVSSSMIESSSAKEERNLYNYNYRFRMGTMPNATDYPRIVNLHLSNDLLQLLQDLGQEVLETEGDVAVTIIVVLLKDVGHALEADAGLHEEVKAHDALAALVVGRKEQLDEAVAEAVAEGDEGVAELVEADVAALVRVEAVEQRPPRGQKRPQPAELGEADRPAAVAVEHSDHHAHRVRVKGRPVAVDERC